ncbi:UDP-4-amino-4,6-dideoxy-N-acetyl-beta-L-altrosamine transaminase [Bradyrhizobium sp. G127]|uniref:UDP-4-amino-4, 6-dideoxy-N-acetyl-beta-L-altrosamine transaminase n=1 Tax=Bradyrhizobium sp. G127 TaxID=2904800 RepID=UPI001F1B063B|nr:UDP-4-amino-4,6-dideoxy-N-acetyl-beta-L-altrosamine transaminase [Bradyrhizobium sp. G127]MCF2524447.1 UDP-4-amino-4,6-dideoxy-N-acetyl-beta-L-altrosamine transaminase [Bradyrhizobium sp. G127]
MTGSFLPYGRHVVDDDDISAVAEVLRGDWLTTGPTVEKFEASLAERVGARFAVACSSGTAGLHMATAVAGLSPGDRAVVPPMTFLATANAVRYQGGDVVFSDVDPQTGLLNIDGVQDIVDRARNGIRAVLPVHLAGQTVDMPSLARLAKKAGFVVIEDACHALGTEYLDGNEVVSVGSCRHSTMAVFSFHPVKTIAMGEGGAVTTNDPDVYRKLLEFRNHGMTREANQFQNRDMALDSDAEPNPWYYEMPSIGFNYRASDIHCALAHSQLKKLNSFIARRRELAARYDEQLQYLSPILLPPLRIEGCNPAWHLYAVRIDFKASGMTRKQVMVRLREAGIGSQVHYIPVHLQPYYRRLYGESSLPGATAYYAATLSLPLFPSMSDGDVGRVVDTLAHCLGMN